MENTSIENSELENKLPEQIKAENIKLIDSTLNKLGYSLYYTGGRGGRRYSENNGKGKFFIYGGFRGVPENETLSQKDIIIEIIRYIDNDSREQVIKDINEKLGTKIPDRFDFTIGLTPDKQEIFALLLPYIKNENYDYLTDGEYETLINKIATLVHYLSGRKIGLSRDRIKLDGNITNIGGNYILMIPGSAIYKEDRNNSLTIKQINININTGKIDIIDKK